MVATKKLPFVTILLPLFYSNIIQNKKIEKIYAVKIKSFKICSLHYAASDIFTYFVQDSFTHFNFGHLFLSIFIMLKHFLKKREIIHKYKKVNIGQINNFF